MGLPDGAGVGKAVGVMSTLAASSRSEAMELTSHNYGAGVGKAVGVMSTLAASSRSEARDLTDLAGINLSEQQIKDLEIITSSNVIGRHPEDKNKHCRSINLTAVNLWQKRRIIWCHIAKRNAHSSSSFSWDFRRTRSIIILGADTHFPTPPWGRRPTKCQISFPNQFSAR
jgi:hypothetical protein